jgi:hypothetical protein
MSQHHYFLPTDRLLDEMLQQQRETNELLREENRLLRRLLKIEEHNPTTLTLSGDFMAFAPGQSARVQLQLGPAGFTAPTSVTYGLTSSDPLVTVTADTTDSTGSTFILSVGATEAVGASVTFSGSATGTNADGSALSLADSTVKVVVAGGPPPTNNPSTLTLVDLPDAVATASAKKA